MTRVTFMNGPLEGKAVKLPENIETWDMLHEGVWHRYTVTFGDDAGEATYLQPLIPEQHTVDYERAL